MRRKDREITDAAKINDIISRCTCCRIGFLDEDEVYIVPLNFGFEIKNSTYTFYFHGAKKGRKIDLLQKNPRVGFEMDTNYALIESNSACGHAARFQSVIGNGVASLIEDIGEKKHGLSLLMKHNTGESDWEYKEEMLNATAVFKLEATTLICKEHE